MNAAALPNSPEALTQRVQSGQITLTGPLVLTFARLVLAFGAQGLTSLFVEDAARWMTVWGTLVDLGSLALMAYFLRREGLSIPDLFRARPRSSALRTVGLTLLYLVVFGIIGFAVAQRGQFPHHRLALRGASGRRASRCGRGCTAR